MLGKEKCRVLKEIRKKIAEENDILLITSECQHKGDCKGTCPKCEAEVRFLENQINERKRLGKFVTIAGLALASTCGLAACEDEEGDIAYEPSYYNSSLSQEENNQRKEISQKITKFLATHYDASENPDKISVNVSINVTPEGIISSVTSVNEKDELPQWVFDLIKKIPSEDLTGLTTDCKYQYTLQAQNESLLIHV